MRIKGPLAAVSLATVIALAGCTSGGEADEPGEDVADSSSSPQEAPEPGEQPQLPEPDIDDVPDVVADVDGAEISRDEFVSAYEGELQQAFISQQSTGQEVDQDQLKQQVAEQLVNNRVLGNAAADAGIEATDEDITDGLEGLAAQNGLGGADEVLAALNEQGVSEEDARADVALQFQITTFLDQESDIDEPSEEDLRAQYDEIVQQIEDEDQPEAEGEIPPFEEAREILADQATQEQQNTEANRILDELLKDVDVTVYL